MYKELHNKQFIILFVILFSVSLKSKIFYLNSFRFIGITVTNRFITKLAKINPFLVQTNMQHLKDQITSVEKLRGVGRDGKLRLVLNICRTILRFFFLLFTVLTWTIWNKFWLLLNDEEKRYIKC